MSANQDHFGGFRDHTKLKHYILESYVLAWGSILLGRGHHETAWFIDAFAGRGRDDQGNDGSPIIAAKAARRLRAELQAKGVRPLRKLEVIAIEKEEKHIRALEQSAKQFTEGPDACLRIYPGTLSDHMTAIQSLGQGGDPRLFFLDPFGLKGLAANVIRDILSRRRGEVLLLFNDTGARRLHGAARAASGASTEAVSQTSFFDVLATTSVDSPHVTIIEDESEEEECVDESVKESAPHPAESILQEAFGEYYQSAVATVTAADPSRRRRVWLNEYVNALLGFGATHVLPFSIMDNEGRHKYYLIHAATHKKAMSAMKEAIQGAMRRQQKERGDRPPMMYVSTVEVSPLIQELTRHFSGQTVRWQDENDPNTVKSYLLERTHALISDFDHIKSVLDQRGWQCKKRPLTYCFP